MDKLGNNPSTVKLSKLESDLLKIKEDIAPQSREKLQTFIYARGEGHRNLGELYIFARLRRITFKFGSFTNFKALFSVVLTDFPQIWSKSKVVKRVEGSFNLRLTLLCYF